MVTVVLDTRLTPELLEEGFYRELVSKIQTMRKEAGFEVMDHIYVYVDKNDKISDIIKKYAETLKGRGNGGQHHSGRHDRIHKGMEYQRRGRHAWSCEGDEIGGRHEKTGGHGT